MGVSLNIEQASRSLRINVATNESNRNNAGKFHQPTVKTIDWHDSSDRKWLMNHLHWAMNNNREVRLVPIHN